MRTLDNIRSPTKLIARPIEATIIIGIPSTSGGRIILWRASNKIKADNSIRNIQFRRDAKISDR
jgi:hypothetical protein